MGTGAVKVKAIQRRQGTGTAHEQITIIGTGAVEVPVPSHDECGGWGMDGTQMLLKELHGQALRLYSVYPVDIAMPAMQVAGD